MQITHFLFPAILLTALAQVQGAETLVVGLDRYYHHETRNGKPYHYAWEDASPAGYSQLATLIQGLGARTISITKPASQETLAGVDVYMIVTPDTSKTVPDPNYLQDDAIEAVVAWVKAGGVLVLFNNDKAHAEVTHMNKLAGRFGITFNEDVRFGVDADPKKLQMHSFPDHPFFQGVKKLHMRSICTLSVRPPAEELYRFQGDSIMALCRYGRGTVFALGDPWGYNEYLGAFDNRTGLANVFGWLLSQAKKSRGERPSWVKVTDHADWRARDSAGEVVYDGKMWLLGGWFSSTSTQDRDYPHDVWSSTDGARWNLVSPAAPWVHADLPTALVHDNRMWIMGGWYKGRRPEGSASNQVWHSTDGTKWTQAAAAPWAARCGAGGAVHHGKMWILGGTKRYFFGSKDDLLNDVWSSADGIHWDLVAGSAPWTPRAFHAVLAFDGKLWVMGGGNYVLAYQCRHDVWSSTDGAHWTKVTENAPWRPRIWHSAVVYKNRMWILGGTEDSHWMANDVWSSSDGANWKKLETGKVWPKRHEQSAYVFDGKIWIAGGMVERHPGGPGGLQNDVWQIELTD